MTINVEGLVPLTGRQLKKAVREQLPIYYVFVEYDPLKEDLDYTGLVNDRQDYGYYGLDSQTILELEDGESMVFDVDVGMEYYFPVVDVDYD